MAELPGDETRQSIVGVEVRKPGTAPYVGGRTDGFGIVEVGSEDANHVRPIRRRAWMPPVDWATAS
jgi:hypothetical protein